MTSTTLLAFDFDGTLAPICEDPASVRMRRAAAALLARATELRGVAVAVVSGRDADDLAARTNASGAYLVASHGLEIRAPGGVLIRDSPPLQVDLDPEHRREIDGSGLRLEEKKHGLALHWRGIPYEAIAPVVEMFRRWAEAADLEVIEGRCVVEARRRGQRKEDALRWLTRAVGATRVVYAGDDVTDFAALRFASENGLALFLGSSERTAPPGVTVVESFRELFRLVREEVMV
jgi:trehalose 6-phosphate phosphatase